MRYLLSDQSVVLRFPHTTKNSLKWLTDKDTISDTNYCLTITISLYTSKQLTSTDFIHPIQGGKANFISRNIRSLTFRQQSSSIDKLTPCSKQQSSLVDGNECVYITTEDTVMFGKLSGSNKQIGVSQGNLVFRLFKIWLQY